MRVVRFAPFSRRGQVLLALLAGLALGHGAARFAADAPPAGPAQAAVAPALAGAYPAEALRVIDGDTVEMRVHVWLGQDVTTHVRLRGVDAPELRATCRAEAEAAARAQERLRALVAGGGLTVVDPRPDKYFGRVVAGLRLADGDDAAAALLREGLARLYDGKARKPWC